VLLTRDSTESRTHASLTRDSTESRKQVLIEEVGKEERNRIRSHGCDFLEEGMGRKNGCTCKRTRLTFSFLLLILHIYLTCFFTLFMLCFFFTERHTTSATSIVIPSPSLCAMVLDISRYRVDFIQSISRDTYHFTSLHFSIHFQSFLY